MDNLAQWGWSQYLANPTSAKMLGWPLHAFGDAAEAQHVANTSGWGHTEMEDAIDRSVDDALGYDVETDNFRHVQYGSGVSEPNSEYGILRLGYFWWLGFKDDSFNLEHMIESVAWQSRQYYNESGAYFYNLDGYTSEDFTNRTYYFNRTFLDVIRLPAENAIGAMIAFLIRAGDLAQPVVDPEALCPVGSSYSPSVGGCTTEPDAWCTSDAIVDWSQIPKKCTAEGSEIELSVTVGCDATGWFKLKNLHTLTERGASGLKIWLSPYTAGKGISSRYCHDGNTTCENHVASLEVYDPTQGSNPLANIPATSATWGFMEPCDPESPFLVTPPCNSNVSVTVPNTSTSPVPDTILVKATQTYDPNPSGPLSSTLQHLQGTLHVEAIGNNYSECTGSGVIN